MIDERGFKMSFDYKRLIKREHNIGEKDAKMRLIGGAVALFISIFTAKIILLVAGLALVATGYFRWCPAYSGMGKNTCGTDEVETAPVNE
jgi:hypothetical protein